MWGPRLTSRVLTVEDVFQGKKLMEDGGSQAQRVKEGDESKNPENQGEEEILCFAVEGPVICIDMKRPSRDTKKPARKRKLSRECLETRDTSAPLTLHIGTRQTPIRCTETSRTLKNLCLRTCRSENGAAGRRHVQS